MSCVGSVQMCDGVISTHTFGMRSSGGTGTLEMCCDSTLIIDGDVTAQIQGYVGNGWISCIVQGCSQVGIDYDNINPGKTTVYCMPACGQSWNPNPEDGEVCV